MYFLTYVSSAVSDFSGAELRELLATCERNNRRNELTGMLLYKDGNFMQVLEGVEERVLATHARISADTRHDGLITLLQGPLGQREFPQWCMGFADLTRDATTPAGYFEFLDAPLTGAEFSGNPSRAQRLLLAFRAGR